MPKAKTALTPEEWWDKHSTRARKPKNRKLRQPVCKIAEKVTPAMIARAEKQVSSEYRVFDESRKTVPNCVADYHLIYRALAAYYAEMAADVEGLVSRSMDDAITDTIFEVCCEPLRVEIPVVPEGRGEIWAEIDETKKMPVITLRIDGERARYRYNPSADKIQRMG